MTKQQKKEIKEILNNEWDINGIIQKIKDIDNGEEISILGNDITYKDDFLYVLQEQEDIINIYDILTGMDRSSLIDNEYFYYDGTDGYPAQEVKEDIISGIEDYL